MSEIRDNIHVMSKCCQQALRQPLSDEQLVLLTEIGFHAAGHEVLTEDNPNQKFTSTRKTYAPVANGSSTLTTSKLKMSNYAKNFCDLLGIQRF